MPPHKRLEMTMNVFHRYAKPIPRALIVAMIALSAAQYPAEAASVSIGSPIGPPAGAESPTAGGCASASWEHSAAPAGRTSGLPGQPATPRVASTRVVQFDAALPAQFCAAVNIGPVTSIPRLRPRLERPLSGADSDVRQGPDRRWPAASSMPRPPRRV